MKKFYLIRPKGSYEILKKIYSEIFTEKEVTLPATVPANNNIMSR